MHMPTSEEQTPAARSDKAVLAMRNARSCRFTPREISYDWNDFNAESSEDLNTSRSLSVRKSTSIGA